MKKLIILILLVFLLSCTKNPVLEEENNRCIELYSEDETLASNCFINAARLSQDPNVCEKITDKNFYADCYVVMSYTMKDFRLCDNIPEKSEKEACFELFWETVIGYQEINKDLCSVQTNVLDSECEKVFQLINSY